MILSDCLNRVPLEIVTGDMDVEVSSVTYDSRKVVDGTLFCALRGEVADGMDFVEKAIDAGACAILSDRPKPDEMQPVGWATR
ncbi:MAG: Mur ligase domain-containing protein [Verrucomicrobiota bacterium]